MAELLAQVHDLTFGYRVGGFQLRVRELHVREGEKVAVIGPSGCGKTTLLHLMAGILVPLDGRIEVDGETVSALGVEDRQDFRAMRMGLVFQEFELLEYLDVLDNVLVPYRVSPVLMLDRATQTRAVDLLRDIGLGDRLHRYPRHLSQGERQRVALCRALVTKPKILLGDEPTGNLDPDNRDHVMRRLFQYTTETGAPQVMVTHDHDLLERFDRTVDMRELAS